MNRFQWESPGKIFPTSQGQSSGKDIPESEMAERTASWLMGPGGDLHSSRDRDMRAKCAGTTTNQPSRMKSTDLSQSSATPCQPLSFQQRLSATAKSSGFKRWVAILVRGKALC